VQLNFSGLGPIADAQGFILALPEGVQASWNSGNCCGDAFVNSVDDVGFVRAVVADVSSRLCVDEARIYATGMSNGGFMAHRLACDAADLFAAVAPVAGVVTLKPDECNPSRPISVMHFHGTEDSVVPFGGGGAGATISVPDSMAFWVDRNGCEAEPEETFRQGNARCESHPRCRGEVDVTLCTIEGGGHCWPGNPTCPFGSSTTDLSASSAMWEFMQQYTMP
jgi:polyhydroxybutyrate depolymerase